MNAELPGGRRYHPVAARPGRNVLVVDNYDSFTFNLVQYLLELGAVVDVFRNDAITAEQVIEARPSHVLLSPGPGRPEDSGVCQELCRRLGAAQPEVEPIPLLGVCLGHQTLCEMHGATVQRADRIMHGKVSPIDHDGEGLFKRIASPFRATRYHSLIVVESTLPAFLKPVARTPEGELMAVRHASLPVFGLQFHPDSIATDHGHRLLENFLEAEIR